MTCEFKRGDRVNCWQHFEENKFYNLIFLAYVEGAKYPYIVLREEYEDEYKRGDEFETGEFMNAVLAKTDLEIDTPVLVRDHKGEWLPRYFAGWDDHGRITTWWDGRTSWSNEYHSDPKPWNEWKLPDDTQHRRSDDAEPRQNGCDDED